MMTREQLQPGNGANYDIIYGWAPCRVKGKVRVDLFLLSWMKNGGSGGVSVIVSQKVYPSYVAEKMGIGYEDARVLAEFINERTGWK
tara:strand:- start:7500 stop:7760 length:261 start_codon:yes stop_codon:yes gene_type:complete